jgi:hypothetical protein
MRGNTGRSLRGGLLAAAGTLVCSLVVDWLDLGVVWRLVALWAIGTAWMVGYVLFVARRDRRSPSVGILWRRTDSGVAER